MKIALTTNLTSHYHHNRNAGASNLKTIWPATYRLASVNLYFWLVADRNDAVAIIRKINRLVEEESQNDAVEIENFYLGIKSITERKSYRPLSIISVAIDDDGKMALMAWRGRILLKRGDRTGVLLRHDKGEMAIRLGKLINNDLLVLINDAINVDNEGVSEVLNQNLAVAKNWQEFSFFSQAYLEQEKIGDNEIGLMILQAEKNPDHDSLNNTEEEPRLPLNPEVTEEELNSTDESDANADDDGDDTSQKNDTALPKTGWVKFKALFSKKKKASDNDHETTDDDGHEITEIEDEVTEIIETDTVTTDPEFREIDENTEINSTTQGEKEDRTANDTVDNTKN